MKFYTAFKRFMIKIKSIFFTFLTVVWQ